MILNSINVNDLNRLFGDGGSPSQVAIEPFWEGKFIWTNCRTETQLPWKSTE